MISIFYVLLLRFVMWRFLCCASTPDWQPIPQCNLTISTLRLNSVRGILFTNDHENGTKYLFSVCGLYKANHSSSPDVPADPNALFAVSTNGITPIGRIDTNTKVLAKNQQILKLSPSGDRYCSILLLFQCSAQDAMLSVLLDDLAECLRVFELQHPIYCDQPQNLQVARAVAFSLTALIVVCLLVGVICMTIRSGTLIHVTLPSLTTKFTLRRWRFNPRRFDRSGVKYSSIPVMDDGFVATVPANETRKPLLSNHRTIIHEDDPQDDLLLSL